jgi:hypothetical protein
LKVHFLACVVDEHGVESAVLHECGDHVPVAVYLENEGGVLAAGADDVQEFFCGRGQELAADVGRASRMTVSRRSS